VVSVAPGIWPRDLQGLVLLGIRSKFAVRFQRIKSFVERPKLVPLHSERVPCVEQSLNPTEKLSHAITLWHERSYAEEEEDCPDQFHCASDPTVPIIMFTVLNVDGLEGTYRVPYRTIIISDQNSLGHGCTIPPRELYGETATVWASGKAW
jgi:hypothetical protein